jgi:hypothetical protein
MRYFKHWQTTGRAFSPADAEAMFGWDHPRDDIKRVFVYSGPTFIEIMDDDMVLFGGVAMEDLEMAEEAAFDWYRRAAA